MLSGAEGVRALNAFFLVGDPEVSFTAAGQEQGILRGARSPVQFPPQLCPFPCFHSGVWLLVRARSGILGTSHGCKRTLPQV